MNVKELYKADYDNLPPDEKAAWTYEEYQQTRAAVDKYFISYGLDIAMIIEMTERAKEFNIKNQTIIDIIVAKLLPPYSLELDNL